MQHDNAIAELIADIPVHIGFYPDNHLVLICHDGTRTLSALPVHILKLIDTDTAALLKEKVQEWYTCFHASVSNNDDLHPRWSVVAITPLHPSTLKQLNHALTLLHQWLPDVPSPGHVPVCTPSITDGAPVYLYTSNQHNIPSDTLAVLPAVSRRPAFTNLLNNTSMLPFYNEQEMRDWCTSRNHHLDEPVQALLEDDLVTMAPLRFCTSPGLLASMAASTLGEKRGTVPSVPDITLILAACVDFCTRNVLFSQICHTSTNSQYSTAYARAALQTMHAACQVVPDSLPVLRVHTLGVLAVCALACHHRGLAREIIATAYKEIPTAQHFIDRDIISASHTDLDLDWIERIGTAIMYGDRDYTMQALYDEGLRAARAVGA